ncbi:hypothetical protein [Natrinema sp. 1APR25-10V2]|uniref:hypothetical protein n=1 Tax=Natrinema sp. 1APR25-10V2 TaxID=2951081 RepID=UPI00287593E9|nr:hypothetical protein [Natrinema sp. 1APR25-10V2]MDS0475278.1 hypothetical protein [Natrinema sp. 1APR25-10V2]
MERDEPIIDEHDFARTYDGGAYADPWDTVEEYQDVMRYASKHPQKGSQAVATATDTPRSRIRTWIDDGGAPDVVRGLEAAREYGWLEAGYCDPEFTGLNALVANVFSGGSISQRDYRPSFALNHRGEDSNVIDALELTGIDYRFVHTDDSDRADEVRPTENSTVLGRILVTLGAPVGPKAQQDLSLPTYLDDAPEDVRETFVYCYLENRASKRDGRNTIGFREQRSDSYLRSLAELIESVADGPVTISEKNIHISLEATENLGTVL